VTDDFSINLRDVPIAPEGAGEGYGFRVARCPRCGSFYRNILMFNVPTEMRCELMNYDKWHDEKLI
jgi:hypothetical protein